MSHVIKFRFSKAWVEGTIGRRHGVPVLKCRWSDGVRTEYVGEDQVDRTLSLWARVGKKEKVVS